MEDQLDKGKTKRIHKRSLFVTFVLVIVPWVLIAVPGQESSQANFSHYRHGWPFTHCDTVAGTYWWPVKVPEARLFDLIEGDSVNELRLDLRFSKSPRIQEDHFWTNLDRWPGTRASRVHWLGLSLNILVLAVLAGVVISIVEYRVRRSNRPIQFSLFGLGVFIMFVSVLFAWPLNAYRASRAEYQDFITICKWTRLDSCPLLYERRLPQIIDQLTDNRVRFNGEMLTRIQKTGFTVFASFKKPVVPLERQELVASFNRAGFPVDLNMEASEDAIWLLTEIRQADLRELSFAFSPVHLNQPIATLHLPNLRKLTLTLCTHHGDEIADQSIQLKAFANCPKIQNITIENVTASGAEYLLNSDWSMTTEIHMFGRIGDKLYARLNQRFVVVE